MSDQASGSGPKPDEFERGAGFGDAPQADPEDPLARLERLVESWKIAPPGPPLAARNVLGQASGQ